MFKSPSFFVSLIVVALCALVFGRVSAQDVQPSAHHVFLPVIVNPDPYTEWRSQIPQMRDSLMKRINEYRAEHGCSAVVPNDMLQRGVESWTSKIAFEQTVQTSPDGWYQAYGYQPGKSDPVDLVAAPFVSPDEVFAQWLNVPEQAALLQHCPVPNTTYDIGIGINKYYWTVAIGYTLSAQ